MISVAKDIMGYSEVTSKGCNFPFKPLVYFHEDIERKIKDINAQIMNNYRLVLMIDSDMISPDFTPLQLEYHWVVLEGSITFNNEADKIEFQVYSWGKITTISITYDRFYMNYYCYIKLKR